MDPIFYPTSNGVPSSIPSESKLATYMVNTIYHLNVYTGEIKGLSAINFINICHRFNSKNNILIFLTVDRDGF